MQNPTSHAPAFFALVFAPFITMTGAQAGVGGISGETLSSFAHSSLLQTVQSGMCWEQYGPDGPGYYPCGDGGGGPVFVPVFRRHHHRDVDVVHSANPSYPGAYPGTPARRLSAGSPYPGLRGVGAPAVGAARVHTLTGLHSGAAPVSPGLAGVHGPSQASGIRVGAPASLSSTGGAGVHAPGGIAGVHAGAPASPGVAGAAAVPRIGSPAAGIAGIGTVHAGGAAGAPHIGAPAAPALAGVHGVGVHGVGGGGAVFPGAGVGRR